MRIRFWLAVVRWVRHWNDKCETCGHMLKAHADVGVAEHFGLRPLDVMACLTCTGDSAPPGDPERTLEIHNTYWDSRSDER